MCNYMIKYLIKYKQIEVSEKKYIDIYTYKELLWGDLSLNDFNFKSRVVTFNFYNTSKSLSTFEEANSQSRSLDFDTFRLKRYLAFIPVKALQIGGICF